MLRTQGVCFAVAQHADAAQRNGPCGLPHPLFVNCIVPFRQCSLATFLGEKSTIEGPESVVFDTVGRPCRFRPTLERLLVAKECFRIKPWTGLAMRTSSATVGSTRTGLR